MRRRALGLGAIAIALALVVAACEAFTGPDVASLNGTAWRAVVVAGQPPVADAEPTIRFDGARLSGTTGCNGFEAGFRYVDGHFQIGDLMVTEIACGARLGEQERRVLEALRGAERIEIGIASLRLIGESGSLDFVPE